MGIISCILCSSPGFRSFDSLARHIRDSHGRQAKKAYREGKWKVSDKPASLFDAVDAQPEAIAKAAVVEAEQAKVEVLERKIEELESPQVPFYIEPKADLIYGATGSGKTLNIGEISDYVLAKYGKLTRMASADGGGLGPISGKGKSGQIEFWALGARKNPIAAIYKAVRGYWPLRLDDPESPLVPPDAGTWEVYGFGAFEGLTSFGDKILEDLKAKKASLSQDPSYTFNQDGIEFSGGNMSYYGFMQDQLQSCVGVSHLLGYEKVTWTGQESKGDDQSGSKVYGPMIGGKKATGKAGGWFLNVWHTEVIAGPQKKDEATGQLITEGKYLLFLKTHIEPSTLVPFPCKIRAPKGSNVPMYLESGSAAEAYKLLDKLYDEQAKSSSAKMDEIAGLRERLLGNAARARKKEAAEAEKRAKAANLLKPMVTVPTMPSTPAITVAPKVAGPVAPKATAPVMTVPLGIPSIQNIRKGK